MTRPIRITVNTAHNRHEKTAQLVKNEAEAKTNCINKWKLVADFKSELEDFADSSCGFCYLAYKRMTTKIKCDYCPKPIQTYCNEMIHKINDLWTQLETIIDQTLTVLEAYEPQGEEET